MKETAHVAYDAYGEFVGWKNFAGNPMPQWGQLPEKIQDAWRAACAAISPASDTNHDIDDGC